MNVVRKYGIILLHTDVIVCVFRADMRRHMQVHNKDSKLPLNRHQIQLDEQKSPPEAPVNINVGGETVRLDPEFDDPPDLVIEENYNNPSTAEEHRVQQDGHLYMWSITP